MKEHDYLLELMSNPTFGPKDFLLVGLSSDNTGIEDKEIYEKSPLIQNNPLFQTDGNFDLAKFDTAYEQALQQYNYFVKLDESAKPFFRDNIYAPDELKETRNPEFKIEKAINPLRQLEGFARFGIKEAPVLSSKEIAQQNPVYDTKTGQWIESPNDSGLKNFFNPKVMAQWDYDADIDGNPTNNPDDIVYHKGEKKIDPTTGTFYYETLDGRNVYGRDVLSGWDTLTTDGSFWNKFDFFDADGLKSSLPSSLTRAAIQIVPALIPQVNKFYIMGRVGLGLAEIFPTIGKVFTGDNNSTLSNILGFNEAVSFSQSAESSGDDAAGIVPNTWTMENGLKMIADVFTQLAEQRWIFKYGNALFSRVNPKLIGAGEEAEKARKAYLDSQALKGGFDLNKLRRGKTLQELAEIASQEYALNFDIARRALESTIQGGQELSKLTSMAYMTGITTASAYNEAKSLGASDEEAALFTLGYTLGEWQILRSDIGKWILPELKLEALHNRHIARTLSGFARGESSKVPLFKKIFNYGKQSAEEDIALSTGKMVTSGALAEGTEEVSEELLLDVSKTLFNIAGSLRGDDTRLDAWSNPFDRYMMSFLGGTVGGSIANFLPGYKAAKSWKDDTNAYLELVYLIRNNKTDDFIRTLNKMDFGSKGLSIETVENSDGSVSYKEAKKYEDSLDAWIKRNLIQQVKMVQDILNSEGAMLSDESLLNDNLIRRELKYRKLLDSHILGIYTNDFQNTITELTDVSNEIRKLSNEGSAAENAASNPENTDPNKRNGATSDINKERLNKLKERQKELRDKLQAYKDGTMSREFIAEALFEMDDRVSAAYVASHFKDWVERTKNVQFDKLSDTAIDNYYKEYLDSEIAIRENVHNAFLTFKHNQKQFADLLRSHEETYFNLGNVIEELNQLFSDVHTELALDENITSEALKFIPGQVHLQIWETLLNALKGTISDATFTNLTLNRNTNMASFEEHYNLQKDEQGNYIIPKTVEEFNASPLSEPIDEEDAEGFKVISAEEIPAMFESVKKSFNSSVGQNRLMAIQEFLNNDEVKAGIIDILKNTKYITPYTKLYLKNFFDLSNNANEYNQVLDKIANSPVEELLKGMILKMQDAGIDVTGMVSDISSLINDLANANNIEEFAFSDETSQKIAATLKLLDLAYSHVEAAKTEINGDFKNLFGYNATINELDEKANLATINTNTANSILNQLANFLHSLLFYNAISNANSNSKLTDHIKAEIKANKIYFQNIKNLNLDSEELKQAIAGATTLQDILDNDKNTLTDEEKEKVFRERVKIELALHNILQNADLGQIFSKFNLLNPKNSILNAGTTLEDTQDFIWYLASIAALDPAQFYSKYKDKINDNYVPVIAQEEAVRRVFSFLVNPQIFEKFVNAYNSEIKKQIDANRDKIGVDVGYDVENLILSANHFLVEGIPGAGKSSAVFDMIAKMIEDYPELTSKIWVVSNSKENAQNAIKGFSDNLKKNITLMDRSEYLHRIGINYNDPPVINDLILISESELTKDEDEIYRYKNIKVNEAGETPSLILIDEVSGFSQLDLLLSNDFAKAKGILAIVAGDFLQQGARGIIKNIGGSDRNLYFGLNSGNFIGSWKLGTVIRADNSHKAKNVATMREYANEFVDNILKNLGANVNLAYYEGLEGLFGDKVTNNIEDAKRTIQLMLQTLDDGAQIKIISDNENSEIVKYINSLSEADRKKIDVSGINKVFLGLEAKYYIIDLQNSLGGALSIPLEENVKAIYLKLYTAISRAKSGSLLFGNYQALGKDIFTNIRQFNNGKSSPLSLAVRLRFAKERKDLLNKIFGNTTEPIALIRSSNTPDVSNKPVVEIASDESNLDEIDVLNLNPNLTITNTDDKQLNLLLYSFMTNETGCELVQGKDPTDVDAVLRLGKFFKDRIDSLNGLALIAERSGDLIKNINGVTIDEDGTITAGKDILLSKLNRLRNILHYGPNKKDIIDAIKLELGILNDSTELAVDFIYKNQYNDENWFDDDKNSGYRIFFKSLRERISAIFNRENTSPKLTQPSELTISAIIRLKNGRKLVELPLAKMTSPLTLLNSEGFEDLKNLFDKSGRDISTFKRAIRDALKNKEAIPHLLEYAKLLELYTTSENVVHYFDNNFTLGGSTKPTGILTTFSERGTDYLLSDEYVYNGEWMGLDEYKRRMPWRKISSIMTCANQTRDGFITINGTKIQTGREFVLVSDYNSSLSDNDLLKLYMEQLMHPDRTPTVRLIYVSPPKATIPEYIFNLNTALSEHNTNDLDVDRSLGNKMTAFRLAQFALTEGSEFVQAYTDYIKNSNIANKGDFIKDGGKRVNTTDGEKSRLEKLIELTKLLTDYEKANGKKALYDLMNTPIGAISSNGEIKKLAMSLKGVRLTLRHTFQSELRNMLLTNNIGEGVTLTKQDNNIVFPVECLSRIIAFINDVEKGGWSGVDFHMMLKHDSEMTVNVGNDNFTFVPINTTVGNNYAVSGRKVQINGKLDSTAFVMNVASILDEIIQGGLGLNTEELNNTTRNVIFGSNEESKYKRNQEIARYLAKHDKIPVQDNSQVNSFIESLEISGKDAYIVKTLLKDAFSKLRTTQNKVLNDPRLFIFEKSSRISKKVNNSWKIYDFGKNVDNIILLDNNILFTFEGDADNVYKIGNDEAVKVELEEFRNLTLHINLRNSVFRQMSERFKEPETPLDVPVTESNIDTLITNLTNNLLTVVSTDQLTALGITNVEVNVDGHLVITFKESTRENSRRNRLLTRIINEESFNEGVSALKKYSDDGVQGNNILSQIFTLNNENQYVVNEKNGGPENVVLYSLFGGKLYNRIKSESGDAIRKAILNVIKLNSDLVNAALQKMNEDTSNSCESTIKNRN